MSPRFLQINAFASRAFRGNPAAVVLLEAAAPDDWLQLVAREFNLSETAFLLPLEVSASTCGAWSLRWFTPRAEVDLCGHATLASAHALREWKMVRQNTIRFHTRSGILAARFVEESSEIALDFPATLPLECEVPHGLPQALGLSESEIMWCGRSKFDIVLQLASEKAVAALQPDFPALNTFEARGVAVTAQSKGGECDFMSRFFAPRLGVDEDPVTGSAHCALAPFWAARLNKRALRARQISERGGELRLQVLGERVEIRGGCVSVLRGEVLEGPSVELGSRTLL